MRLPSDIEINDETSKERLLHSMQIVDCYEKRAARKWNIYFFLLLLSIASLFCYQLKTFINLESDSYFPVCLVWMIIFLVGCFFFAKKMDTIGDINGIALHARLKNENVHKFKKLITKNTILAVLYKGNQLHLTLTCNGGMVWEEVFACTLRYRTDTKTPKLIVRNFEILLYLPYKEKEVS